MVDAEGQISIPLEEFWEFVGKYLPASHWEVAYGVPRVEDSHLVIDYAASTDAHPKDWMKKPVAVTQWDALKKK